MEAGVGAEGVEDMYDLESNKETGALIVCLFKPPKCLVLLAEPDANKRGVDSRRVAVTVQLLDVVEDCERLLSLPR